MNIPQTNAESGGTASIFTIHRPAYKALLIITADFHIQSARPLPNRWRRFWYWALLGWRWEKLDVS